MTNKTESEIMEEYFRDKSLEVYLVEKVTEISDSLDRIPEDVLYTLMQRIGWEISNRD